MKCAYIFDIDGTVADLTHRLHYILREDSAKDWDTFYTQCIDDRPIPDVVQILRRLDSTNAEIIFVTGRSEICYDQTRQWLDRFVGIKEYLLFMRAPTDHREDKDVKQELFDKHIKGKFIVLGAFEDRKQCVDMWRENNITCYQVANGDY